jgi:TolA-binding protein
MKKLSRVAASALLVSGLLAFAQPAVVMAAPKASSKSPTNQGATPRGKPFVALNSRIDALQAQIDGLIGQFASVEEWMADAQAALETLEQNTAANAAAIALLESELAAVKATLDTKQNIISGTCPDGQYVYEIDAATSTLVCRADLGANGLAVSTVLKTEDIPAESSDVGVLAECPAGSVPTGGSADAAPDLDIAAQGIVANGYSVTVANVTGAALPLNVTATCLGVSD